MRNAFNANTEFIMVGISIESQEGNLELILADLSPEFSVSENNSKIEWSYSSQMNCDVYEATEEEEFQSVIKDLIYRLEL